jgi:dienelactone hydrolase
VEHLALLLVAMLPMVAGAQERVTFTGPGLELRGVLYQPEGRGPFPAVVLLHGCSGLWARDQELTRSHEFWGRHLRDRGFIALLVDSFGPRGEKEICTQQQRGIRPSRERADDAWAAQLWLAASPAVDPDRIFVLGWSNGGTTALNAVLRRPPEKGTGFRAAVAFYPGCGALAKAGPYRPAAPVLIQAGRADDWTPAADCEALARSAPAAPGVEIDVYEGAHHAFDRVDGKVRYRANVSNPTSPTGRGATVGPHPEARSKALQRVSDYLEQAAKAVPRGTKGRPEPALP